MQLSGGTGSQHSEHRDGSGASGAARVIAENTRSGHGRKRPSAKRTIQSSVPAGRSTVGVLTMNASAEQRYSPCGWDRSIHSAISRSVCRVPSRWIATTSPTVS